MSQSDSNLSCLPFLTQFLCQAICTQRTPKGPKSSDFGVNEHGIYIRHCQESNSQPVPSQAGADPTRPQCLQFWSIVIVSVTVNLERAWHGWAHYFIFKRISQEIFHILNAKFEKKSVINPSVVTSTVNFYKLYIEYLCFRLRWRLLYLASL